LPHALDELPGPLGQLFRRDGGPNHTVTHGRSVPGRAQGVSCARAPWFSIRATGPARTFARTITAPAQVIHSPALFAEHPETPMPVPTPFHARTQALCTSYRWKDWAGYYAVCSFDTTHEREYFAFRESAGLLDVTPLYKYEVAGPEASALLARMMVRD